MIISKWAIFLLLIIFSCQLLYSQEVTPKLEFSHPHGFYDESFVLTITSNVPGSKIYYTVDGSYPITSNKAIFQNSPLSIEINPNNTKNRDYAPGFVIRAYIEYAGAPVSEVKTSSFIFVNKIIELSRDNKLPGPDWLQFGAGHDISYGLDPEVYKNAIYSNQFESAFLSIPSISLVTNLESLFSPDSGIYVNALHHGKDWERSASIELLNPDGSKGFQINCGLRIRGGWSRHYDNPKHAFRFIFREEYGNKKLNFPIFDDEGVDKFDNIDLRTAQNYSWSYNGDDRNTFIREVFSRDTQRDMNQPYTRSRYYHLYINGTYWGLYQTQERSEASFAESYFGGNAEDYDVIKVDVGDNFDVYNVEATDGSLSKWKLLWDYTQIGFSDYIYYKVQGLNTDGTKNPTFEKLLDVDNLIDYMIITFFTGDFDGPISGFRNNESPNNFYAIYNRVSPDGFKFFRHDGEHTLFFGGWGEDRTGPFPAGENFFDSNPQWIHQKLSENKNYRLRFADRVYKHFFNNGVLTLENNRTRINERKTQIESAIIAESARWGDSKGELKTKAHWTIEINNILYNYLPARGATVLNQLENKGLFFTETPPQFNAASGIVEKGFEVKLNSPNGEIYYTTNGGDPLIPAGNESGDYTKTISPFALKYSSPIPIFETTKIRTRSLSNGNWSMLNEAQFIIDEDLSPLRITEVHYHPIDEIVGQDTINDKEFEFIEIKNVGSQELNLTGSSFSRGITFSFPNGTIIQPNNFIVLASNTVEFNRRYGFNPDYEYEGQLDNSGETLEYMNAADKIIFSFKYDDNAPWPETADGDGYSMVSLRRNPISNPAESDYWVVSNNIHGSPGVDDLVSDISNEVRLPNQFMLYQNFPNPFNPSTTINYSIPMADETRPLDRQDFPSTSNNISLIIYDVLGREVTTLVNEIQKPGHYQVQFDASKLTSGIYFYRIIGNEFYQTKRMLLLK